MITDFEEKSPNEPIKKANPLDWAGFFRANS
jgi:hypothetical protein